MAQRQYDHLVAGISQYPDLEKRLRAELAFSRPKRVECGKCSQNRVLRKFKELVDIRRKKEPPRRY